jgi:Immunity protein 35
MLVKDTKHVRALAERYLATLPVSLPIELAIRGEPTMETEFGWIFFGNSKKYLETGEFQHTIPGNAPFIVDRGMGPSM